MLHMVMINFLPLAEKNDKIDTIAIYERDVFKYEEKHYAEAAFVYLFGGVDVYCNGIYNKGCGVYRPHR